MASRKIVSSLFLNNLVRGSSKVLCNQSKSTVQHQNKRCISLASQAYQRYFTEDHEWVDVEGNVGTIGITDHAQNLLGELVYVEFPEVGDSFEQNEAVGVVESVKAASDVMTPVSGTVSEINEPLGESPGQINSKAETDGWLFKIELSDAGELDELMDADAYKAFVESES